MIKNILKIVGYFTAFIAVGALAFFLFNKIVNFDNTGKVPMLVGKSLTEATELLNKRKLFLNIQGKQYNDEIKPGNIVSQSVYAGKEIRVGAKIDVIVSKGPELYSMPSFEGQNFDDAKLTLINLGMKLKKVTWVHSDTFKKGRIIAQRPLPGNIESNEINFLVSMGQYTVFYRCPSFVNMTIDDARLLAKELGITLIEKKRGSKVIFQKPEAEARIKKGDTVEVTLGRGWGMWF